MPIERYRLLLLLVNPSSILLPLLSDLLFVRENTTRNDGRPAKGEGKGIEEEETHQRD
jgi:hypothetical protein